MGIDSSPLVKAVQKYIKNRGRNATSELSERSGVPASVISKIYYGKTKNPDPETWEKFYKAFPSEIPVPPWLQTVPAEIIEIKTSAIETEGLTDDGMKLIECLTKGFRGKDPLEQKILYRAYKSRGQLLTDDELKRVYSAVINLLFASRESVLKDLSIKNSDTLKKVENILEAIKD